MKTMADATRYPTRIAPYGLRMPDNLKARIQAAAETNNRSMNAEIVATLEEKYPDRQPMTPAEARAAAAEVLSVMTGADPGSKVVQDAAAAFIANATKLRIGGHEGR